MLQMLQRETMHDRMRVFFLSFTPPLPSWGGSMTFFRHFCERNDFDVCIATNSPFLDDYELPYTPIRFDLPNWWQRLNRTRLQPWTYVIQSLHGQFFTPRAVLRAAKSFDPDVVFTMGGSWNWTALAAKKVASSLNIPLVSSFNDWFDYPWFPGHPASKARVQNRFIKFYRESDLALCTSDGMIEALGEHQNAHVLYPTGAPMRVSGKSYQPKVSEPNKPLTILFGGNLGEWYGPMLESLVKACDQLGVNVKFQIFGSLHSWSESFHDIATKAGIFRGKVSFAELASEAERADLLLLPMGFGDECAHIERTSFKTKFLDYLTFQRPILVWGPDYCSATRVANVFDSAERVTSSDAVQCALAIQRLVESPGRRSQLVENAEKMYEDRFHPDTIHRGLVDKIHDLRWR